MTLPEPDNTAVRVALWRALHLEVDGSPPILSDDIGLKLAAPSPDWRERGDMHPQGTRTFRAAIVARARFIEDLVTAEAGQGVVQYVILGAGLDTFAQRRPEVASRLGVFEVDRPVPQAWKRQRLDALGYGVPAWLRLVPVDFEHGGSWWDQLNAAGFDKTKPAVVSCAGVSMYLTQEANVENLRQIARLAPGSTLAMTFIRPFEDADPAERPALEGAARGAAAAGTPFISFYRPSEILALAREAGFKQVRHVSGDDLAQRYFAGRADGLDLSRKEEMLIATT